MSSTTTTLPSLNRILPPCARLFVPARSRTHDVPDGDGLLPPKLDPRMRTGARPFRCRVAVDGAVPGNPSWRLETVTSALWRGWACPPSSLVIDHERTVQLLLTPTRRRAKRTKPTVWFSRLFSALQIEITASSTSKSYRVPREFPGIPVVPVWPRASQTDVIRTLAGSRPILPVIRQGRSVAGTYGNRTHQEPVSKPLTGFEDRAGHQPRTRSLKWRLF